MMKQYKVELVVRSSSASTTQQLLQKKIDEMAQMGWELKHVSQSHNYNFFLFFEH
ncbi:MAG: hypothetical protein ACFFBD_15100 [Candidatus Hodarchaeota archaeon]